MKKLFAHKPFLLTMCILLALLLVLSGAQMIVLSANKAQYLPQNPHGVTRGASADTHYENYFSNLRLSYSLYGTNHEIKQSVTLHSESETGELASALQTNETVEYSILRAWYTLSIGDTVFPLDNKPAEKQMKFDMQTSFRIKDTRGKPAGLAEGLSKSDFRSNLLLTHTFQNHVLTQGEDNTFIIKTAGVKKTLEIPEGRAFSGTVYTDARKPNEAIFLLQFILSEKYVYRIDLSSARILDTSAILTVDRDYIPTPEEQAQIEQLPEGYIAPYFYQAALDTGAYFITYASGTFIVIDLSNLTSGDIFGISVTPGVGIGGNPSVTDTVDDDPLLHFDLTFIKNGVRLFRQTLYTGYPAYYAQGFVSGGYSYANYYDYIGNFMFEVAA